MQYSEEELEHAQRFKNRVALRVRQLEARKQSSESSAKIEAMRSGIKSEN